MYDWKHFSNSSVSHAGSSLDGPTEKEDIEEVDGGLGFSVGWEEKQMGNIRPCPKVQLDDFENTDEHGAVDGRVNMDKAVCIGWPCLTFRLDQYTVAKFAESFDTMPKFLEKNAGLNATEIISSICAEHASGNTKVCLD
ncbi:hypothetical protein ACFX11_040211 [Malus domestica]